MAVLKRDIILSIICCITAVCMFCPEYAAGAEFQINDTAVFRLNTLFRGFYVNDRRIQWSGQEATFGVEASIMPVLEKKYGWGTIHVESEFYFNQPFGDNILANDEREKFRSNFDIDPFEISQLNIQVRKGHFSLIVGKIMTPFGKVSFPEFLNEKIFSPFIRTEAILWRETGLFIKYRKNNFVFTVGAANGDENRDTNSSKAGIVRIAIEKEKWSLGFSGKKQDGIGSEHQKLYKNHAGIDISIRSEPWLFSGEVIYDEYGFREDIIEDEIDWPRSLYYRDIFYRRMIPITGIGGYADVQYIQPGWLFNINYGYYLPQKIGNPNHDDPIHRGIVRYAYHITEDLQLLGAGLFENKRSIEEWRNEKINLAVMLGLEYHY